MLRHPFPILWLQYYGTGLWNKDFTFEMDVGYLKSSQF